MTRRESREVAFIVIFEKMFQKDLSLEEIFSFAKETDLFNAGGFAKELVKNVFDNLEEVDAIISDSLVGWSADRLSKVSRSLLRLAVSELNYTDVPVGVAINEAVEICKKYSTEDDASYINGVLATVAKKVRS